MGYYDKGFANTRDDFYSGDNYVYRCYTYWAKSYTDRTGLCIVKYQNSSGHYTYSLIGTTSTNPFYLVSSGGTIENNVNNWANRSVNNVRNSQFYYNSNSKTDDNEFSCNLPDYDNTPTSTNIRGLYDTINDEVEPIGKWVTTDIPIFTVTNTDFDKLNDYITSGDDSGADNYEDLHPKTYVTDVWLDGNFPNIYYKTSYEGETELEQAPTCLCVISAIPSVSPVEMVRTTYEFGAMQNVAYGQYSNPTAVPLVNKTPYGIAFTLDNDNDKKCQATFYIDKSGNVSDIVTTNSSDGKHSIVVHEGAPSETDYSDGSTANGFNTNPAYNKFSGANTLTKTYKLSNDGVALKALGNFLWSSTFKDNVLSLTNYPLENIIAIKAMPLIEGGTSEEIKIGNVLTGINGDVVVDADSIETIVGSDKGIQVPRYFNNFIDYSEVDIMIYLPYIGFKKIDNLVAMKRSMRVKYYFDVIMGNCLASIEFKADTGDWLLYDCYQGNCGIDISLTSTNRANIENGYINNALSAVNDIMSLNPVGLAKDVFNGMTQDFHSQSTGVGNPSVMNALDTMCRLIIKRPAPYEPTEYGHTVGYPCYKYMNLSELSGFTQCENFICSLIPYATDGEKAEIKSLLESGIFIF